MTGNYIAKCQLMYNKFFDLIGHTDTRLYINKWQIYTIEQITKAHAHYKNLDQTEIVEIAGMYFGMGCWLSIFVRLVDSAILIFQTGGSNPYEQQEYHEGMLNYRQATSKKITYPGTIYDLLHMKEEMWSCDIYKNLFDYVKN